MCLSSTIKWHGKEKKISNFDIQLAALISYAVGDDSKKTRSHQVQKLVTLLLLLFRYFIGVFIELLSVWCRDSLFLRLRVLSVRRVSRRIGVDCSSHDWKLANERPATAVT